MRKRSKILVASLLCLVAAPAAFATANLKYGPTSQDIEQDIASIDTALQASSKRCENFGDGSVLKVQCAVEGSYLHSTKAMLQQKKLSWLRWINLDYTIPGQLPATLADTEIRQIEAEIAKEQKDLEIAKDKAARYGGLIQTMALVEEQTKRVSISILRQRFLMSKYGAAFPLRPDGEKKPAVGKSVDDKGAL